MSYLYKEVLIETAEQVEYLGEGTFLLDRAEGVVYFDAPEGSAYEGEFVDSSGGVVFGSEIIGCTAYVPVDVREEKQEQVFDVPYGGWPPGASLYRRSIYMTPWTH